MRIPKYEFLIGQLLDGAPAIRHALGPAIPSFHPRHYKFYWQVFTLASRCEGHDFLQAAPRLCSAHYLDEIARLAAEGTPALVYGYKLPRRDPANPFDMNHPKWKDAEFAPAWDLDQDPVVEGGHK